MNGGGILPPHLMLSTGKFKDCEYLEGLARSWREENQLSIGSGRIPSGVIPRT